MSHIPDALLALGRIKGERCDVTVATRNNHGSPLHTHPSTNYVLVSAGTLHLTLDGTERPVSSGEWCIIPAGAEHAERFEEETSVLVFWVKEQAANA
ncbi:cupin domain-containing protein [Paraburkholderia sp.]|uniref:cupin domain-containing protein n=1 Tax=Paraburkholderia sp. TaxID=1926495 RepID=UPI0025CE5670|nr:cupin domain-containing protein [Paraburkholderia sp.]